MNICTRYKPDWPESAARFDRWWRCLPTDRPLLCVDAPRAKPIGDAEKPDDPGPPARYLDFDYLVRRNRYSLATRYPGGDTCPTVRAELGPGALSLYLGSEPNFTQDTVWFKPSIDSLDATPLPEFDPENRWLRTHLDLIARLHEAFWPHACTAVPDIVESLDILAAMRDPMHLLTDLLDAPEGCHRWLRRINDLYHPCFDAFYRIVRDDAGANAFTYPAIWGPGRTLKVQCDFAAMISPAQFAEFYVPYVAEQIRRMDFSVYHLDGPDAIRHADELVAIDALNAVQWVPGAGRPDGGDECWHPLYEKVLGGGKALEVYMSADQVPAFVRRFGSRGVYILTRTNSQREADELVAETKRLCGG